MATMTKKPVSFRGFTLTDVGAENEFLLKSRWVAGDGNQYAIDCYYSPELHTYQWIAFWYRVPVGIATSLVQAIEILDKFPSLGVGYIQMGGDGDGGI